MAEVKKILKNTGRPCSVCAHKRVAEINSMINVPMSFRAISCQFFGNESARESIRRHTANCLKLEIAALIQAKKIENAINHYDEITEQLAFAKDLRIAARDYLACPDTGKLTLIPRSDEISVIYEDLSDTTPKGNPKRKTDTLDVLLERAESGNVEPLRTIIKHVDIRQYALNAIGTVDLVLDKIARIEGNYFKDKENSDEFAKLKQIIESAAERSGSTYADELQYFVENFAGIYKPDLVKQLQSEMVN